MKLYKHQKEFLDKNPDKAFLCWEGGCGKTIGACIWLAKNRDEDALVIVPKRIIKSWQETLKKWNTKATVLSKEQFKKIPIKKWSSIVVDEADEFASPLFTKNRSQLSTALYNLIKTYPETPILLATATPIRSSPNNLHTLLCFLGKYIDKIRWRDHFYNLEKLPFLPRPAWMPKKDWRQRIRPVLEKYADIVLLKDCVEDLPPITEHIVNIPYKLFKNNPEWSPMASFVALHKYNQENKPKFLIEIGKKHRKALVVAHYLSQIEQLQKELSKDKPTYVIHGSIKNQESIIKEANKVDDCYLIVQASLGAGWECPTFSAVIFASLGYSVRNWQQMKYRTRRINDLRPVAHYYLLGGKADKAILTQIQKGKDFLPAEWKKDDIIDE